MRPPIDLAAGLALQRDGIEAFLRALGQGSRGGEVFERDGVVGALVPAAAHRSVVNSVVYRDPASLEAALDPLAEAYGGAGVRAWTVWVPEHDRHTAALLAGRGHLLDAEPEAMVAELADLRPLDSGDLDWDAGATAEEVGRVNDLAYGVAAESAGGFAAAIGTPPPGAGIRFYRARSGGETASVLATIDVHGDCVVFFVATLRGHRGQRLAGRLLHAALLEARDRGMRTSTLQASRMGLPVYRRLGYVSLCRLQMWERRQQPDGAEASPPAAADTAPARAQ